MCQRVSETRNLVSNKLIGVKLPPQAIIPLFALIFVKNNKDGYCVYTEYLAKTSVHEVPLLSDCVIGKIVLVPTEVILDQRTQEAESGSL